MIQGETILSGAPIICIECKRKLDFQVLESGAGYYIGSACHCGPYSRESGYFKSRYAAQTMLDDYEPEVWARHSKYRG